MIVGRLIGRMSDPRLNRPLVDVLPIVDEHVSPSISVSGTSVDFYNHILTCMLKPDGDLTKLMEIIRYCVDNAENFGLLAFLPHARNYFRSLNEQDKLFILKTYVGLIGTAPLLNELDSLLYNIRSVDHFAELCTNFPWMIERALWNVLINYGVNNQIFDQIDDTYILSVDNPRTFMLYYRSTSYRDRVVNANMKTLERIKPEDTLFILASNDINDSLSNHQNMLTDETKNSCWRILLRVASQGSTLVYIDAYYQVTMRWGKLIPKEEITKLLFEKVNYSSLDQFSVVLLGIMESMYGISPSTCWLRAIVDITNTFTTISYTIAEDVVKALYKAGSHKLLLRFISYMLHKYNLRNDNIRYYVVGLSSTQISDLAKSKFLESIQLNLDGKRVTVHKPIIKPRTNPHSKRKQNSSSDSRKRTRR